MNSGAMYIAITVVLVILIGFVLTMVNMLAKTAGSKIRNDMQKVISAYDSIISSKQKEIEKVKADMMNSVYQYDGRNANVVNLVQPNNSITGFRDLRRNDTNISISSFIIPSVSYRSSVLADNYEEIKNSFEFNEKSVKKELDKIGKENKQDKFIDACQRIIDGLSFDAIYELATRKPLEQVELLKKGLKSSDMIVLDKYLDILNNDEKFDGIKFYDWIKRSIAESSDEIEVRSSSNKNEEEFDPSICDGYRLYVGNKMYDYAISKKDVS